jgi:hypothetical protein
MNIRTHARALLAVAALAASGPAAAQGFASVSSLPPAPSTPTPSAAPPPAAAPVAPPASGPAPAFASASSYGPDGRLIAPAAAVMADRILVEKSARRLYLLSGGSVIAEYPVRLGLSPKGHKQYEGDFRTPEGTYYLSRRNPNSEFFLSVEVSYPNEADRARAEREGLRPGGLIMIHGQPNVPRRPPDYYANNDWTDGCIAVSNDGMRDIWQRTRLGIPIEIRP